MNKKKYFPNNWKAYSQSPDSFFIPITYKEFTDWKVNGWMLPSSVDCIIREEDPKSGKVKEFTYKREHAARKKTKEIMEAGNHFVICTANHLEHMKPEEDWADEDY